MTTWTDQSKSSTTFTNESLTGVAKWDDANAAWDSPLFSWDAVKTIWMDLARSVSTSSTTNNPFFGWLFWFTQSNTTSGATAWTNQTKSS